MKWILCQRQWMDVLALVLLWHALIAVVAYNGLWPGFIAFTSLLAVLTAIVELVSRQVEKQIRKIRTKILV